MAALSGLVLLALIAAPAAWSSPTSGKPLQGRVVFLGDSITYAGQYVEFVETGLRLFAPTGELEVLNLGLPSETVSGLSEPGHAGGAFPRPDLHERLSRVLQKTHPNVVIACYGMNDGIYYPFGEERFQQFQAGIRRLHDQVTAAGARIIFLTPPVFDPLPIKEQTLPAGQNAYPQPYVGYNEVLDRYAAWLLSQRARGWEVVDVHGPINQFLAAQRQREPQFCLARDGVHPDVTGHWLMAQPLLTYLVVPAAQVTSVDQLLAHSPAAAELLKLVQQRQRLLKDAWLTEVGHQRPGMQSGQPLAAAQKAAAELASSICGVLTLPTPIIQRDSAGLVTITCSATDAVVRYTLDGTAPEREAGPYLTPIRCPWAGTIKARVFAQSLKGAATSVCFPALEGASGPHPRPHSALFSVTQNRDWRIYDWAERHAQVLAAIRSHPPGLVFIGDSITHFFAGDPRAALARGSQTWEQFYTRRNAVNLGFGWDRTENVLWRLQHGEVDGVSPKAVVVLIGTNNLQTNTPEEIAEGIRAICQELHARLPKTRILLLGLLPRSPKPDALRARLGEVNILIARMNGEAGVTFLDIGGKFVQADGSISPEIMGDYLHPTAKGYALFAEAIEPTLAKLLGE